MIKFIAKVTIDDNDPFFMKGEDIDSSEAYSTVVYRLKKLKLNGAATTIVILEDKDGQNV